MVPEGACLSKMEDKGKCFLLTGCLPQGGLSFSPLTSTVPSTEINIILKILTIYGCGH